MMSHDDARAEPGGADEVAATRDVLRRSPGRPVVPEDEPRADGAADRLPDP